MRPRSTVTAEEYSFDLSATPTADTEEVVFDNVGKEFHVMVFARINEGFTLEEAIELQGEKGSAEIVAETERRAGATKRPSRLADRSSRATTRCCARSADQDGAHYELGQLEEFSIE